MNITLKIITVFIAIFSVRVFAGEYPVIVNNFDPDEYKSNDDFGRYFLYKNRLIRDDFSSDGIIFDPLVQDADFPDMPISKAYTHNNGSPRNILIGDFDETSEKLIYQGSKFLVPTIQITDRNQCVFSHNGETGLEFGLKNVYKVIDIPREIKNKTEETRTWWSTHSRFFFKLEPPLALEFVPHDAVTPPLEPGEELVQGGLELGGAIVCGRKENEILTLYRLSCSQRTRSNSIQVFNPDEKLAWDIELSDTSALAALLHLRPDLLEHNTGVTENRLYVRMKPYTVKFDKPGMTKALRDWYLLAPFYDPVSQIYRETLTRQDFVPDTEHGFNPDATDFDPSKFIKKLVPYVLPTNYWDE